MPRRERQVKRNDGNEDRDYEVEMILESQIRDGQTWYFIKWQGFDETWNSWEPENFLDCPDLLEEFKKRKRKEEGGGIGELKKRKKEGGELELKKRKRKKEEDVKKKSLRTKASEVSVNPRPVSESEDVEVVKFLVMDRTKETAVLVKINDQYDLVPYKVARSKAQFQIPIIDYLEKQIVFNNDATEVTTQVLVHV